MDTEASYFPEGQGWAQVYEYTHNYLIARYGRSADVEDAASDGFTFTFDKWAKAPSTKLGEWDKSMAFAFALRIARLQARKALGKYFYSDTLSLDDVLSPFEDDEGENYSRLTLDGTYIGSGLIDDEENALALKVINWCLDNPRQRRWMEDFLSMESGAAIARKTAGDTTVKACRRKQSGIRYIQTVFGAEIDALR